MPTRLTGDYMELFTVTSLGATDESETKIGETKGDVVLPVDITEAQVQEHDREQSFRKPVRFDNNLEFEGTITSTLQALTDLGLLDTNSILRGYGETSEEAIRLKVYENESDTSASQEWDVKDLYVKRGDLTFPTEDFADWQADCSVNGDIEKVT